LRIFRLRSTLIAGALVNESSKTTEQSVNFAACGVADCTSWRSQSTIMPPRGINIRG
jgi:hypothetical protein